MTGNDLKKLNRKQLLELLLKQTLKVEELEGKLHEMEQQLADRTLTQKKIGSIAEASLKLNGVFEAAEAAAAQYIDNIRKLSDDPDAQQQVIDFLSLKNNAELSREAEAKCAEREAEAERKIREADLRIAAANKKIAEAEKIIAAVKKISQTDRQTAIEETRSEDKPKDILEDFFSGVIGK